HLAAEVLELRLRQPSLEERARVDAGRRVALEEHLVPRATIILTPEKVIEADFIQAGGRGIRREMPAQAGRFGIGAHDHRGRVPAHDAADAQLHLLVTGERRLLLGRDGVDVARLDEPREPHVELPGALEDAAQQEVGALAALRLDDTVQRLDPLAGLDRVAVGQLPFESKEQIEMKALGLAAVVERGGIGFRNGHGDQVLPPGGRAGSPVTPSRRGATPRGLGRRGAGGTVIGVRTTEHSGRGAAVQTRGPGLRVSEGTSEVWPAFVSVGFGARRAGAMLRGSRVRSPRAPPAMTATSAPVSTLYPARRGSRPLTAEDLWTLPRVGAPVAFPDGQELAVPLTRWNI